MTVSYDLTEEDWIAYYQHYLRHTKTARPRAIALFGVLIGLVGGLFLALGASSLGAVYLLLSALMIGLGCFYWPLVRRNNRKYLQKGDLQALFGATQITLAPDGIHTKTPISDGKLYWSAVQKVVETETHIYIQFSAAVNTVIPKRAFATTSQGVTFLQLAEEYRQAATGQPIPTIQRGAWWTQGKQVVEPQEQRLGQ